jgi:predicted acylesterase/phospholipase RssA
MANRGRVSWGNRQPTKTALVLSAGAPHSPLMAGALYALREKGKTFDIIYTSGAGALIGLLYMAPKDKTPEDALKSFVEMGVSDSIYRLLPVGYKTFFKPGPFTQPIHRFAQRFKLGTFPLGKIDNPETSLGRAYNKWIEMWETPEYRPLKRLYNDLVDLWAAAITPTTLNFWSKGMCQPLPFLEDLVDFRELNRPDQKIYFYTNAFCVSEGFGAPSTAQDRTKSGIKPHLFHNKDEGGITPEQVRAAFAFPFIYPPVKSYGELYFEGADRDPISFGNLLSDERVPEDIKTVVLIDILGSLDRYLLREPRNLWDAFGISIIAPPVAHAKKEVARFHKEYMDAKEAAKKGLAPKARHTKMLAQLEFLPPMEFKIPEHLAPHMTDWSYSNMSSMFQIGCEAGKMFWDKHERAIWG